MNELETHTKNIQNKIRQKQRRRKIAISVLSLGGTAAFVLVFALILFVPYTAGDYDISRYRGSEYYTLMQKIGDMTYSTRRTNHFTEWGIGGLFGSDKNTQTSPPTDESSDPFESAPSYEEVTDMQAQGVIEGDLFKRSEEVIYYVSRSVGQGGFTLDLYSVERKERMGGLFLEPGNGMYYYNRCEIFLSDDYRTVFLFTMCRSWDSGRLYTEAAQIDVSDPENVRLLSRKYVTGGYLSARMTDGVLLLATTFHMSRPDFSDQANYLPQAGDEGNLSSFPREKILVPKECKRPSYTVLVTFSEDLEILDRAALLSYSGEMYVSKERIFLSQSVSKTAWIGRPERSGSFGYEYRETAITCYSHADGLLLYEGTASVKGELENRYCMDEYEGVLRVVTTSKNLIFADTESTRYDPPSREPECNLYCVDLKTFRQIASVENFADEGESVKSARFDGAKAYVCTAKIGFSGNFREEYYLDGEMFIKDPVFEFDLSDYGNIVWKDTGTISGYSMSLMKFKDDTLLGIGKGEHGELKIEAYRSEESSVIPVARETFECLFSQDFKSYFVDAERGLVGLAVRDGEDGACSYLLLRFDGKSFRSERITFPDELACKDEGLFRACRIEEELFILSPSGLKTISL